MGSGNDTLSLAHVGEFSIFFSHAFFTSLLFYRKFESDWEDYYSRLKLNRDNVKKLCSGNEKDY